MDLYWSMIFSSSFSLWRRSVSSFSLSNPEKWIKGVKHYLQLLLLDIEGVCSGVQLLILGKEHLDLAD